MSFQTTNAPPNKWLLVEIIHRIALFSEGNAVAALSRTCTWLRACIVDYDNLWYHLYQYDFPLNMDQKINWIQWQLEEEHALSKLSNNKNSTNNSGINNRTWLQRYNQRNKLKSNWLRNRPTWTIDLLNTEEHTLAGVNFDEFSCISTCPGWAILANKIDHPVYLVELSAKKSHKIHKLEWRENKIDLFYSAAFIYDHQGRYGTKEYFKNTEQTKRGVFLAIHTYNDQYFPSKLQLWRVCNQELVRVISWDGGYSTRIVDSFLILYPKFEEYLPEEQPPHGVIKLFSNIFSTPQSELQPITISKKSHNETFAILTVNDSSVNLLRYDYVANPIVYEIVQASTDTASNIAIDNEPPLTTIGSGSFSLPDGISSFFSKYYQVDQDRFLFYRKVYIAQQNNNTGGNALWRYCLVLISIENGMMWNYSYLGPILNNPVVLLEYNLIAILSAKQSLLEVISLSDGKVLRRIDINELNGRNVQFEQLIDTLIVGASCKANQYYIVDVVTGQKGIYTFSTPDTRMATFTPGHMLVKSNEIFQIISFVPEFI